MNYYECIYCGRIFKSEGTPNVPHNCKDGFRKNNQLYILLKVLNLPVKGKWYDMIESGEKKEEYRDNNRYWNRRLFKCLIPHSGHWGDCQDINGDFICPCFKCDHSEIKRYTHILFRYGYTKRTMLFKLDDFYLGKGEPDWGAPDNDVFILKLGNKKI